MGAVAAFWGLGGIAALLIKAIWALAPMAWNGLRDPSLGAVHWAALAGWMAFMAYFEGYKGFQRGLAPRAAARAAHLAREPRPLRAVLAPLFCLSLFHASRPRLIASWAVLAMVTALVAGVRFVEQPWRGIVDAGVVLGLTWGLVALAVFGLHAASGRAPAVSPDVPA